MHGGNAGAPSGKRNGNYRHGFYTKEALGEMAMLRRLLREARETVGEVD